MRRLRLGTVADAAPPGPPTPDEKSVRLARKRFARRQWARRWLAWRRVLAVVLVLALVAGSVWLVFFSPVLAVDDVRVEGDELLEPTEVRRAAAVPVGEPLATVDLDAISARILDLAPVKDVDVSRAWPDAVRIAVQERVAVAVVERDGVVRGVDAEGVVFRGFPTAPDLPELRMGVETESEALTEAATVVGVLPPALAARVDFVDVESIDTIALWFGDGRTVFWGSADDSANKAKVIAVLLKQKATVYDVSVPGQPTIKP